MELNPSRSEKTGQELLQLREKIDATDERIVALLAERQSVVEDVVALKKANNLPIYHPAREEDLIYKRRKQGEQAGLNPDYIEELYRAIIHQSRVEQGNRMATKAVRPGGVVLIVGGSGGMGRYFTKWFNEAGYEVRSMGRAGWPNAPELCAGADLVIISVPIDITCEVAAKLGPHLPPNAILTDLTSIKEIPMKGMLDAHKGPVVGLHPLFGPTTTAFDKQIIVATEGRDPAACQWLLDQLSAWGGIIVKSTAEEHDRIMEIVQCLRHFATFGFGQFLAGQRIDLSRSLEFSSPIYRLELGMVGRLFAQDASLYSEIIFASPERLNLLKEYLASMAGNLDMLEKGDKARFNEEFGKIAEWFGPFSGQAMRESSFLIDKLIERF